MAKDNRTLLGLYISLFLSFILWSMFDTLLKFYLIDPFKLLFPETWQYIFTGVVVAFLLIIALIYKGIIKTSLPKRLEL